MAITLPTQHRYIGAERLRPAGWITNDADSDLEEINQQINANFARNTRILASAGDIRTLTAPLVAAGTDLWKFPIRIWDATARVDFHVYGTNVDVKLTIDGVVIGTVVTGGVLAMVSLGPTALTGVTPGTVLAEVWVEESSGAGGSITWWCLEETPYTLASQLPVYSAGAFGRIDDGAFADDIPLDGVLRRLRLNAMQTLKIRSRGTAVPYPIREDDGRFLVSSAYWRLAGPYVLEASPWAQNVDFLVRVGRINDGIVDEDVEISAMHESETLEDAVGRAFTISGATIQVLTFSDLPVSAAPDNTTTNRYYLCYRSAIDTTRISGPHQWDVAYEPNRYAFTASNPVSTAGPVPFGRCIASQETRQIVDSGSKGTGAIVDVEGYYDLASIDGDAAGNVELTLSPNPYLQRGFGLYSQPFFDVLPMGIGHIYGVWLDEQYDSATDQPYSAVPGRLPSALKAAKTARAMNRATAFGVPMIGACHHGQERYTEIAASTTRYGHWTWIDAASQYLPAGIWMVPRNPNPAAATTGDATTAQILACCDFMLVRANGKRYTKDAQIDWRLVLQDKPDFEGTPSIATGTTTTRSEPVWGSADVNALWTLYDAERAGRSLGDFSTETPTDIDHNYTVQATWPGEQRIVWTRSPVVAIDVPAPNKFPLFAKLEARNLTGGVGAQEFWCVVASAWCWYTPREEL